MSETAMDKQGAGLLHITNTIRRAAHIYDDTNDMDIRLARFIARYMHDNGYRRVSTNEPTLPPHTDGPNRRTILAQPADTNPEERRMKDIDWSTAPEGYPVWIEDLAPDTGFDGSGWHRDDGDRYTDEDGEYWTKPEEGIYRVHSQAPQWNGEGLPPAGVVCLHEGNMIERETRIEVTILAHTKRLGMDVAVFQYGDTISHSTARFFHPIRTPEQIAAEERENELNRMVATVSMLDKGWARKVCAGLYDAGYRMTAEDER